MPAGTEVTDLAYLAEGYCLIEAEGEEFAAYCIGHRDPEIFEPLPSDHAEAWARQFFRVPFGDQPAWIALDPGWDAPEGVQQGDVLGYGEVGPAGSFPGGGL